MVLQSWLGNSCSWKVPFFNPRQVECKSKERPANMAEKPIRLLRSKKRCSGLWAERLTAERNRIRISFFICLPIDHIRLRIRNRSVKDNWWRPNPQRTIIQNSEWMLPEPDPQEVVGAVLVQVATRARGAAIVSDTGGIALRERWWKPNAPETTE